MIVVSSLFRGFALHSWSLVAAALKNGLLGRGGCLVVAGSLVFSSMHRTDADPEALRASLPPGGLARSSVGPLKERRRNKRTGDVGRLIPVRSSPLDSWQLSRGVGLPVWHYDASLRLSTSKHRCHRHRLPAWSAWLSAFCSFACPLGSSPPLRSLTLLERVPPGRVQKALSFFSPHPIT